MLSGLNVLVTANMLGCKFLFFIFLLLSESIDFETGSLHWLVDILLEELAALLA